MRYNKLTTLAAIAIAATGCSSGGSTGGLDVEQSYIIALTSASEVPTPKPTTASGTATVLVYPARIDFELAAANMTGIRMAHIHSGAVGVAGPIVVTLYAPATASDLVNGVFVTGSLNAANLPSGVTLESLKTLLLSGNAYVNVHTVVNPTGEIRGQLR